MLIPRRDFLKLSAASGLTLLLSGCSFKGMLGGTRPPADSWPIERGLPDIASPSFYGDDPTVPHSILWNKEAFLKEHPLAAPQQTVPLVVIGGGMAGLTSAYLLRDYNPIVLEQAQRFGGNSKGQSWRDLQYSIGAAYIVAPEDDSAIMALLKEIGVAESAVVKTGEDPVALGGKIYNEFWHGETSASKRQFNLLRNYFLQIFNEEIPYPNIPPADDEGRGYINKLDQVSFLEHLRHKVGGKLHPHIEVALQHYCWSSLGGTADEISAACGLNFYAAEFGDLWVFPGGNSFIAEALLKKLQASVPASNLRPSSLVFDVNVVDDGVDVSYLDSVSVVRTIRAKAVVMAAPKFVAKRVMRGLEDDRLAAMNKLRYRAYLVANVCLKQQPAENFYDLYMLGAGSDTASDRDAVQRQGATDVVLANFASSAKHQHSVLTLYKALPYDGGRPEVLAAESYGGVRAAFEKQVTEEILPLLGLNADAVHDMRIARWGHALPLAATGQISSGLVDQIRKPFGNRVFFVEQDNWALPAFETSVEEALAWSTEVRRVL